MINYKKLITSRNLRFKILNALSWIPDNIMLAVQYRIKMGRKCNLKHPRRWTEKLQVYKIHYRNDILCQCVDKYDVREYVKNKGCGNNLVEFYGVWNKPEDIDFASLPSKFVLKTTNGGGGLNVLLVKDKNSLNKNKIIEDLHLYRNPHKSPGREWAYEGILKPRIICEELLVNTKNPDAGIEDFKILCFHGDPKYIIVDKDRYIDHKRNIYTVNWERVDVTTDHDQFDSYYPAPKNLNEMLKIARKLSVDFPFVRVDLYNIDGKIYFGELTFYPWSGYVQFSPDSFDYELGDYLNIDAFMSK